MWFAFLGLSQGTGQQDPWEEEAGWVGLAPGGLHPVIKGPRAGLTPLLAMEMAEGYGGFGGVDVCLPAFKETDPYTFGHFFVAFFPPTETQMQCFLFAS